MFDKQDGDPPVTDTLDLASYLGSFVHVEAGGRFVEKEQFGNISKIDVKYSDGTGENTIVNIVRNDGSIFVLYVSSVDGLDKVFVRQLQRRWDTVKAAKEGLTRGES